MNHLLRVHNEHETNWRATSIRLRRKIARAVSGLERARKWQAADMALGRALLEIDRLLEELSKEKLEIEIYSEELASHIKQLKAERFELFSALESLEQ